MTRNQAIAFGAVGLAAGGILLTVLGRGGRGSSSKGSGKGTSQPGPNPAPAPSPGGTPDPNLAQRYPGLVMIDMRAKAPKERIDYIRGLDKTTAAVIHQTGFFGWKDTNPLWPEIKAHFVVRQDGRVQINYDPEVRMTTGSNAANSFAVTIEFEGNFPNTNGNAYMPEKFGVSHLEEHPAQVIAGRKLLADLKALLPNMTAVFGHRQWSDNRENDPGPDLWREVAEWAKQNLGLTDGGPGWKYGSGQPIPDDWRGAPLVA